MTQDKKAVEAFSALAHGTRLAAFRLLVEAGSKGVSPGEIGEKLGVPPTTLSFHLSQLSQAGLVAARREGKATYYTADFSEVDCLVQFLLNNCCRDAEDPQSPARLAGAKGG